MSKMSKRKGSQIFQPLWKQEQKFSSISKNLNSSISNKQKQPQNNLPEFDGSRRVLLLHESKENNGSSSQGIVDNLKLIPK